VIYKGRETPMEENKARYARDTKGASLADAISGADLFLGLSGPRVLTSMVTTMATTRSSCAANPEPEIVRELAIAGAPGRHIATGARTTEPVNNVLCFRHLPRGARRRRDRDHAEMKLACVRALAELAPRRAVGHVAQAIPARLNFGRDKLIPKPFDRGLVVTVPPAVAKAP